MERVEAYVPEPLVQQMNEYKSEHGYENTSQAIRALLRSGLENHNIRAFKGSLPDEERERIVNDVLVALQEGDNR